MLLCSIAQNPGKTVNLPVLLLAALCTSSGVIFSTKLEHEHFAYLTILVEILFLYITKLSLIIDIRPKRVTFHSESKNDKPGKFRWNVNISSNWLCHSKICRLFIDKKNPIHKNDFKRKLPFGRDRLSLSTIWGSKYLIK